MTLYYGDDDDLGDRQDADQMTGRMTGSAFSGPVAGGRRRNRRQRYTCPTCKAPGALSAFEHARGYQCHTCADREEGRF